jgi:bifunctional DNA-binding transcriptional regulator/antitoxin component of YhaV-PrlF toxin-antitoxin module
MGDVAVRVTDSGQLSLPAELRRRWGARRLLVSDRGDHAVVRPLPDDPIAAARGVFRDDGPPSEVLREQERRVEAAHDVATGGAGA